MRVITKSRRDHTVSNRNPCHILSNNCIRHRNSICTTICIRQITRVLHNVRHLDFQTTRQTQTFSHLSAFNIILISRQRYSCQNTHNRYHDHQFDEREALMHFPQFGFHRGFSFLDN